MIKEEKIFQCDQCSKTYARSEVLRRHKRLVHEAILAGECSLCEGKHFMDLKRHELVFHADLKNGLPKEKLVKCDHCEKTFDRPVLVKRHVKIVSTV